MDYYLKTFTKDDINKNFDFFLKLRDFIFSGGAISNINSILDILCKSYKIYVLFDYNNKIIGTLTLKLPDEEYRNKIIGKLKNYKYYKYELGYSVIAKNYRNKGLSTFLNKLAFKEFYKNNNLNYFITCRANNLAVNKVISKFKDYIFSHSYINEYEHEINVYVTKIKIKHKIKYFLKDFQSYLKNYYF